MLNQFDTLRVAVLCSSRAPGLDQLLRHPQRGSLFEITCVVTSEDEVTSRALIDEEGIPLFAHPIRRFHKECGASMKDIEARRAYDAMTLHVLQQLEVDFVVLLGYLYVVTDVLLSAYPARVVNVHDADLTIRRPNGERKYVGLHSTRDAIVAGEPETRSTLHLVTSKLDGGPVLVRSEAYPVAPFVQSACAAGQFDIVKAYAYAQREWMMRDSWSDLVVRAIEMMMTGSMSGVRQEVAV